MVHCAQPVAIVTTRLRQHQGGELKDQMDDLHEFHGATISSFSSIAMHPYPLVAFSLQLPSRLASALHAHTPADANTNARRTSLSLPPHFVINLLSTHQKDMAHRFSRPDLYPLPLAGVAEDGMKLTKEGQPILLESVGCISCAVVHSLRLDGPAVLGEMQLPVDRKTTEEMEQEDSDAGEKREGRQLGDWNEPRETPRSTSELFIARVIRLETLHPHKTGIEGSQMPLVYFRKRYTTAAPPETSGAEGKS
jgi:flavin reductase (DIM6/NTAB) family NADH-FMN oxidoreductase RutF